MEYVLKHSESILKKNYFKKFGRKFSLCGHFRQKTVESQRKIFKRENFFQIDFFGLEYVLKHSESILKKRVKLTLIRSGRWAELGLPLELSCLKTVESQRKFSTGKFFSESTFRFRIRFKTFWIDSEKKFFLRFWSKISTMWPFWSKTVESQRKIFKRESFLKSTFSV